MTIEGGTSAAGRIRQRDRRLADASRAAYDVLVDVTDEMTAAAGKPKPGPYSPEVTLIWSTVHGFVALLVERRLEGGTEIQYGGDWRRRANAAIGMLVGLLGERFPPHSRQRGRSAKATMLPFLSLDRHPPAPTPRRATGGVVQVVETVSVRTATLPTTDPRGARQWANFGTPPRE